MNKIETIEGINFNRLCLKNKKVKTDYLFTTSEGNNILLSCSDDTTNKIFFLLINTLSEYARKLADTQKKRRK